MTTKSNNGPRMRYQLIAATFARMVINTAHRMPYAFLPVFSRGMGVSIESLNRMLSVRGALGMASPLFGPLADRFGRRNAMLIGLGIFLAGLLLIVSAPGYGTFFVMAVLVVVSKFIFDPALQAYLGDRTPYSQRGLVIALSEFGWSGAVLIGTPLVGYMIERAGWRAPFAPIAAVGFIAALSLWFVIPRDAAASLHFRPGGFKRWAAVFASPSIIAALSIGLIISAANDVFGVVYARWLERDFGLSAEGLGWAATVIGVAELAGEGLVAVLADRLGKRRAVALGLGASAVAYGIVGVPVFGARLQLALGTIFLVYLTFEFTIVASLPLINELVPEARGTVASANVAFHAAGRMIGPLLGGYLFTFGLGWNGVAAAALNVIGIPLILWVVREPR